MRLSKHNLKPIRFIMQQKIFLKINNIFENRRKKLNFKNFVENKINFFAFLLDKINFFLYVEKSKNFNSNFSYLSKIEIIINLTCHFLKYYKYLDFGRDIRS